MNHESTAALLRNLETALACGVTPAEALSTLAAADSRLNPAAQAAASGADLSLALSRVPGLEKEWLGAIEADPEGLVRLAGLLESSAWRDRQVSLVLVYPLFLLSSLVVLSWFLFGLMGGQIEALLTDLSLPLNSFTQLALSFGKALVHPVTIGLEVAALAVAYAALSGRGPAAGLMGRLPFLSGWIRRSEAVAWLEWMEHFLKQDMPVPEALRAAAVTARDPYFRRTLLRAADRCAAGSDLAGSLERVLPPLAVNLLKRGESLEFPPGYLSRAATCLKREQELLAERGLACLEFLGLAGVALSVPPVVIAYMLPLYHVVGSIGE